MLNSKYKRKSYASTFLVPGTYKTYNSRELWQIKYETFYLVRVILRGASKEVFSSELYIER